MFLELPKSTLFWDIKISTCQGSRLRMEQLCQDSVRRAPGCNLNFDFRTTRWPSHTRIMGALQDPYTLGQRVVREQKLPAAGPSGPPTIRLESCPDMCMCPINYLHIKNYPSTLYFFEMDQCHFVKISWGQVTCLFKSNHLI